MRAPFVLLVCALGLTACSEMSQLPAGADMGPDPTLPPPPKTLIPTVLIAPAKGWPGNAERVLRL